MSTNAESAQLPRCPKCKETIRPGTAFCGNCGTSVSEITNVPPVESASDSDATASFIPVAGDARDSDSGTTREPSPWAPPSSSDYAPAATLMSESTDAGTPAPSVIDTPQEQQPRGIRGLLLGTLAIILIAAVFSLYIYDAWLSESARSTVEGWLPWLQ